MIHNRITQSLLFLASVHLMTVLPVLGADDFPERILLPKNWAEEDPYDLVRKLVKVEDIEGLEHNANRLREKWYISSVGNESIMQWWSSLTRLWNDSEKTEDRIRLVKTHLDLADKWQAEFPDSQNARIYRAYFLVKMGWVHRGGGYANTVTKEGFENFDRYRKDAAVLLKEIDKNKCPLEWYDLWMQINAPNCSSDQLDRMAEELFEKKLPITGVMRKNAWFRLPRWGGSHEDVVAFATRMYKAFGPTHGPIQYALYTKYIAHAMGSATFADDGFDWEKISHGYQLLLKENPRRSAGLRTEYLEMACRAGEKEIAKGLFELNKPRMLEPTRFRGGRKAFDAWRHWAVNNTEMPSW